ncbi:hypothetical protein CLOM_g679 [Closterium sp. NIES-68]|nr:hypothetical protein CLOM_g679 [Closterium sp. NIES-68]GJP83306.1 hypothetical protein CLOP_g13468 [Closterium sp. NIES-67]
MADAEADARAFTAADATAAAAATADTTAADTTAADTTAAAGGSAASGPTGNTEEDEATPSPPSPTPLPTAHVDVKEVEVSSRHGLITLLKQHEASRAPVFLLFLADHVPSTNQSWCPDCRKSEPVIATAVTTLQANPLTSPATSPPALLVRVWVGDRPTWKSADNAFRFPPFAVGGVPTLMNWDWAAAPAAADDDGSVGGGGDGDGDGVLGAPGRVLGEYETRRLRLVMELMMQTGV